MKEQREQVSWNDFFTRPRLRRTILHAWASALESGTFEQGTKSLVCDNARKPHEDWSYCCLGVLCEIIHTTFPYLLTFKDDGTYVVQDGVAQEEIGYADQRAGELPYTVWQALGLGGENPDLMPQPGGDEFAGTLDAITLNDDRRASFSQIAARVRATFGL